MMFVLGWVVGKRSTNLDSWVNHFRHTPARWLLIFTDPWLLAVVLAAGVAVALYAGRWWLAAVMVASPLVGIVLANLFKHVFGRKNGGSLAYPSGHTTAVVVVMGWSC
jgi:hypothetical protein